MIGLLRVSHLHDDDFDLFLKSTVTGFFIRYQNANWPGLNYIKGHFELNDDWEAPICPSSPLLGTRFQQENMLESFANQVELCYEFGKRGVIMYHYRRQNNFTVPRTPAFLEVIFENPMLDGNRWTIDGFVKGTLTDNTNYQNIFLFPWSDDDN
jgi:hypothetical protein